ncbi:hypothetical protein GCM10025762_20740 [Haloechinothrix salitolerans]
MADVVVGALLLGVLLVGALADGADVRDTGASWVPDTGPAHPPTSTPSRHTVTVVLAA